jgi:hypothetical protein
MGRHILVRNSSWVLSKNYSSSIGGVRILNGIAQFLVRQPSLFSVSLTIKIKSFVTTPFTMSDQISQLDLHKMQHQVKVCEGDFR